MRLTRMRISALHYSEPNLIAGFVFGRVLGDLPVALICFALAFAVFKPVSGLIEGQTNGPVDK